MTKRIIYTDPVKGNLCIVRPLAMTVEQIMAREDASRKKKPDGTPNPLLPFDAINPCIVEEASTQKDRYFRNAWKQVGTEIDVDMAKARTIHMDNVRKFRNKELERLDTELKKAEDASRNQDAAVIKAERQRLRDIPQTFDLNGAETTEALKALWPNNLPGKPQI